MTRCIVCDSVDVREFLDLKYMALANKFLTAEELTKPEPKYPLRVGFCHHCGHVQLMDHVPPEIMFENYLYISSMSDTLKAHLYDLATVVTQYCHLGPNNLVIDVGCNDGTLLSGFRRYGVQTLGVDPARNLAELTQKMEIDCYTGLFNSKSAEQIVEKWGHASVITATNTFPHIPELEDFVEGLKTVLAPGGMLVMEMHYLVDLLDQLAFDTIYHEHVSYWALGPMIYLFERYGMEVIRAERLPIHHGQLRVFVQRKGDGQIQSSVAEIFEKEEAKGLKRFETFQLFSEKILQTKQNLNRLLMDLLADGKRIVGYGAPAKGNTLLGFLQIGPEAISYIADRSPLKQARYTPGTHIPVVSPDLLLADQPDYVLLLAWNFAEEILRQQTEYRRRGGKFIIPLPEVEIVI